MSSASRHLYRSLVRLSINQPAKRRCRTIRRQPLQPLLSRTFTTTTAKSLPPPSQPSKPAAEEAISDFEDGELTTPDKPLTVADLDPEQRADYEALNPAEQSRFMAIQNHIKALLENSDAPTEAEMDALAEQASGEIEREMGPIQFRPDWTPRELNDGFWQDGEDDEFGMTPDYDDSFDESMITSVAESELEVQREIREYTRIAAWELPLLNQFIKPYKPPTHTTPLRFRYTTYMGETHPSQNKVVLEFCTADLKLPEAQRTKLTKLLGPRYNPITDYARLSSEQFENAAQNKRYLGDLVQTIVKQAGEGDMFEDIPLDTRHVKKKRIVPFPEEWKMKSDTVTRLVEERGKLRLEGPKGVVDGAEVVRDYVRSKEMVPMRVR